MIHNPYPIPTSDDDKAACRFQTYLSGEDKGLLFGIRPIRGTPQAVVNHLIRNLCDDLRELNITTYHPDADYIFAILVERRPLSRDQISRIRRTASGLHRQVQEGVRQHSGGTSLRQGLTSPATSSNNATGEVKRRVKHSRKTSAKAKTSRT